MKIIHNAICLTIVFMALSSNASLKSPSSMLVYTRFRGGLDPANIFNPFEESVTRCTYQSLVRIDEQGRIVGDLAKSWTFTPDKTSIIFDLNPALFSNGKAVTAQNVVNSFLRLTSSEANFMQKKILEGIVDHESKWVRIVSPTRVKIQLRQPYAPMLSLLTSFEFSILPRIPKVFENGSAQYNVTVLAPNLKFLIQSKLFPKIRKRLTVTYNLDEVMNALRIGAVDVIAALPVSLSTQALVHSNYVRTSGKRFVSTLLELNVSKEIFQSYAFRDDLRSLIGNLNFKNESELIIKSNHFVPNGLLLPHYYKDSSLKQISLDSFKKKWTNHINKHGLSIWIPEHFLPKTFIQSMKDSFSSFEKIQIHTGKYPDVKHLFDRNLVDVTALDPSSYFSDPDSFLHLWEFNRPNFPFSGTALLKKVAQYRFLTEPVPRLKSYARAIHEFEKEAWVIPLFQSRYPIFHLKSVKLPDVNLTTFNLLCNKDGT